ncbi:uncharacterized protein [Parasteatoda tepidariorum]|uniref:uncharacterized protein n=1 Tax=Parasteatoda tepidariorum TaxID=114398 RepID=UPI00077FD7DC|nr:uncharacterized protein LOC107443968 [Parasteatoda tepidariorum]
MLLFYLIGILFAFGTPVSTAGDFAFCLQHIVCKEKGGITKTVFCAEKMVQSDIDFVLLAFGEYFPDHVTNMKTLLEKCCEEEEKGKEASLYYYEKRIKNEGESDHTFEQKKGLAEARACMMFMVEDCILKKAMGMI